MEDRSESMWPLQNLKKIQEENKKEEKDKKEEEKIEEKIEEKKDNKNPESKETSKKLKSVKVSKSTSKIWASKPMRMTSEIISQPLAEKSIQS